ncbi:MAG: LysR family transcriptional regulator [Acetobacteraceae bacterium]|nr:LysR family transcriptional regulator [Acetobacteraceae bacterium]
MPRPPRAALSLELLQVALAAAQEGSLHRAASRLDLSQPAAGARLAALEARLGLRLFERHARGLRPSAAANDLLGPIREAVAALERLERLARALGEGEFRVSLGATPTATRRLLPDLLLAGAEAAPPLRFDLRQGLSDDLAAEVADGRLDAALCYDPETGPAAGREWLFAEDLCLVGPASVLDGAPQPIPFRELARLPLLLDAGSRRIRQRIETLAREQEIRLPVVMDAEPPGVKRALALRQHRCMIVPYGLFFEEIAAGLFAARRIADPALTRRMALLWRRGLPAAVVERLRRLLRAIVARQIADEAFGWRPA